MNSKRLASIFLNIALIIGNLSDAVAEEKLGPINANQMALIVNDADPTSQQVADYYQTAHKVPDQNIIHITLNPTKAKLSKGEFYAFANTINNKLTSQHRAVLFLWHSPYQVECQSITSAFTLGFDTNICANTCSHSQANPLFNRPYKPTSGQKLKRLSMLLPTKEVYVATEVIDNAVLSRQGIFKSSAYYLRTSDKVRNSRVIYFPKNGISFKGTGLSVINKDANYLKNVQDIMIYQTGTAHVKHLDTVSFLPGALADHLTSFGGKLSEGGQMSVVEWLRAGASASYGTVSEPCNYWQKFPNPSVLLRWYVSGDTAIEAYWKSVAWPAQGLFVGDPLAQPFAKH